MKSIRSIVAVAVALVLMIGAYDRFGSHALRRRVDLLEAERTALRDYIERLSGARRVAQVHVLAQCLNHAGEIVSHLRWQEVRADGLMGIPVELETVGMLAYFEGFVIKFEHELVGRGDSERGQSLVLFRRVFGEGQTPDSVPMLDREAPAGVHRPGEQATSASLWARCWELVRDAALRERFGVRVAQIEAPAVPLDEGQVWEVTLDASGGLNLTLVESGRNFIPPWCGDRQGPYARFP